jgi:NADH-quinone oxidoreductase subunit J
LEALFYIFSIIAIFSALMVILVKNPLTSALYIILCFFALAGFYILLNMQFLAAMQILVYAGAIIVLIVLVIMLLNLAKAKDTIRDFHQMAVGIIAVLLLFAEVILYLNAAGESKPTGIYTNAVINKIGNTQIIGQFLFTKYVFPFEVASILLLVAVIGAYIFAKK